MVFLYMSVGLCSGRLFCVQEKKCRRFVVEKKRRWENKKRFSRLCVALATGEQRGEMRRVEGRKFFRLGAERDKEREKRKKAEYEGNKPKKGPRERQRKPP